MVKKHQYTIRNGPDSVDRALRKKAAARKLSLNGLLVEALAKEAGVDGRARHHDLDHLIGTWANDPAVDRALKAQRQVNPKDWR